MLLLCVSGAVTSELVKPNGFQAADGLDPDRSDSSQWAAAALVSFL